ncbi:MAG: DUF2304 domain-containing protein [bacterium]|nr:DUF2304 domain-containing protein [bacterium]
MLVIQIILVLFFLLAIFNVIKRYREGAIAGLTLVSWFIFWVVAMVVVIRPNDTFYFAHLVGIGRGSDLIVYSALAIMFFLFFRLTVKIEKMNKDITKLTREMALGKSVNCHSDRPSQGAEESLKVDAKGFLDSASLRSE